MSFDFGLVSVGDPELLDKDGFRGFQSDVVEECLGPSQVESVEANGLMVA